MNKIQIVSLHQVLVMAVFYTNKRGVHHPLGWSVGTGLPRGGSSKSIHLVVSSNTPILLTLSDQGIPQHPVVAYHLKFLFFLQRT